MLTASALRKTNIAEYLLYMWQVEDLIRANGLDIDKIQKNIIDPAGYSPEQARQVREWYESLIDMMRREEVAEKGHLQINRNTLGQIVDLHRRVFEDPDPRFNDYRKAFYAALPYIVELRSKAGENKVGEIETCLNALYGMLMLRLQKKEVSEDTVKAMANIAGFLRMLAEYFALDDKDELFKESVEDGKQQ